MTLRHATGEETFVERTAVWFAPMSAADIAWYVASGEPLGKAGAYAIQGLASRFVTRVDGSYPNVVGLPTAQVHARLARDGRRLTNIVFMGMGEPLLNLDNVLPAIEALNDRQRFGLGARHITVSTSGVVPGMRRLTALGPQFTLAVSLHAATDDVRDAIVPLNRRHPLREVLAACRLWAGATGKRFTFEVIHLPGVNDRPEDVAALAHVAKGFPVQINLMRYNPIPGAPYRRPKAHETAALRDALARGSGRTVTVRRSRGMDVEGACGQLRLARETVEAGRGTGKR